MRDCLLTPPARADLPCLLNQWEAWFEKARCGSLGLGKLAHCLECPKGESARRRQREKDGRHLPLAEFLPDAEGGGELKSFFAGRQAPRPILPEWLGDATPAVRRAYLREAVHGRQ